MSQARSITVASRTHGTRRHIDCRQLDLDEVIATDRWEIVHPVAADRPSQVMEPLQDGPGTVVLWTKLDRVLNFHDPFGGWADRHLAKLAERLDIHLGMVFGRFLSGQARRRRPLTITINGSNVGSWDPFCLDQDVHHLPAKEIEVDSSLVRYRPYVLPPQREFTDDVAWRHASGPNQWNRQQGLYIYRADRMIQSGGWSRLRGIDEHVKLARAALEFWPELDESFEINISKMRVRPPEALQVQLKPLVQFLSRAADERYRKSGPRSAPRLPASAKSQLRLGKSGSQDAPSAPAADQKSPDTGGTPNTNDSFGAGTATHDEVPLAPDRRRAALEHAAASVNAVDVLDRIRAELHRSDPEVARDLGW